MARGSSLSREPRPQRGSAAKPRTPEGAAVSAAGTEAQRPSSRLSHAGPGKRGRARPGAQLTAGQPRRCRQTGSAKPRAPPRWPLQPPAPLGHSAPWTPRPATAPGLRRPHRARAAGNARQRGLGVAGPRAPCAARGPWPAPDAASREPEAVGSPHTPPPSDPSTFFFPPRRYVNAFVTRLRERECEGISVHFSWRQGVPFNSLSASV